MHNWIMQVLWLDRGAAGEDTQGAWWWEIRRNPAVVWLRVYPDNLIFKLSGKLVFRINRTSYVHVSISTTATLNSGFFHTASLLNTKT